MSFLDSIFGGGGPQVSNNQDIFQKYANQTRQQAGTYQPWVDMGNRGRGILDEQYSRNINDPNSVQNQIAAGYEQSPYQKYMLDMNQKRMNMNAANTGMLGSGAAQRALQQEAINMSGAFQNDYVNRGMNSYNSGMGGWGDLTKMGYGALGDQNSMIEAANAGELQGGLSKNAYDTAQDAQSSPWGDILGLGLGAAGAYFGGPSGAMAGYNMGKGMGGGGGQQQGGGMNLPNNWDFLRSKPHRIRWV